MQSRQFGPVAALVASLCLTFSSGAAGWRWLNPLPTGNNLHAVQFLDENTGFAGGAAGTLLKTTDAGLSWSSRSYDAIGFTFTRICFPSDTQTGFLLSDEQHGTDFVLRTADGGRGWTRILGSSIYYLKDMSFAPGGQTGYVVGFGVTVEETMAVFKTTDGGASWQHCAPGRAGRLNGVDFPSGGQTGFAVGEAGNRGAVFKTTDGGLAWTQVAGPVGPTLQQVSFPENESCGYAVGAYGVVLKTTDAGTTWDSSGFESGWNTLCVDFSSNSTGHVLMGASGGGAISRHWTTDGGASWALDTVWDFYPAALDFLPGNSRGFMVGLIGDLKSSTDGGATWAELTRRVTRHHFQDVVFPVDTADGFAVGTFGSLFRTTDAGLSWTAVGGFDSTSHFSAAAFPRDFNTGFVAGWGGHDRGFVLKTTDRGGSWDTVLATSSACENLAFPTATGGFVRAGNLVYRTTDAGVTWVPRFAGSSAHLRAMDFPCSDTGYVVGDGGALARTTDAGESWTALSGGLTEDLMAVEFLPGGLDGYVAGHHEFVAKTTDGGETWQSEYLGSGSNYIYDILFPAGVDTGYAVGERVIYRTTDRGAFWHSQAHGIAAFLTAVCFPCGARAGFAVGMGGAIITTLDGGGGVEEHAAPEVGRTSRVATIVRGVLLLPPSLSPSLPASLLDAAGRKVLDLRPGANDVSGLAPGVYFVRAELSAASRQPSAVTKVVIAQ